MSSILLVSVGTCGNLNENDPMGSGNIGRCGFGGVDVAFLEEVKYITGGGF